MFWGLTPFLVCHWIKEHWAWYIVVQLHRNIDFQLWWSDGGWKHKIIAHLGVLRIQPIDTIFDPQLIMGGGGSSVYLNIGIEAKIWVTNFPYQGLHFEPLPVTFGSKAIFTILPRYSLHRSSICTRTILKIPFPDTLLVTEVFWVCHDLLLFMEILQPAHLLHSLFPFMNSPSHILEYKYMK